MLDEISKTKVESIKHSKLDEDASNGTVNRTLALLRSILNRVKQECEWLDSTPKVRLVTEDGLRVRWLTQEESARLINELPKHLEAMVRFTLSTGLRESNVTGLHWHQIDMSRHCACIHADQAKGKKAIAVTFNDDALAVIRQQIGKHGTHIFTYKGLPVTRANNHAWRKALKRADITDFRWHDLRHIWASWHVQNGTPLHVLKELGGRADLTRVLRYAHLSIKHLEEYAGNSKL